MRVVVQKYGGSSVSTIDKLKAVARKIVETRRAGFEVVAVVSAMGTTTDELLSLVRQVSPNPATRELDMLISVGERIAMSLLAMAIFELGEHAVSFTGSQCEIITNDAHSNARIIEVRPFRVMDQLARGRIVVVAGFQGMSYRREITTLGRGGSDTTAIALAAALGAEHCDIFSDFDGVYSSDPRVVESAEKLCALSYEEMQELARQGARVLNSQAVEFARRNKLAIYARATFAAGEGTKIFRTDGMIEAYQREERAFGAVAVAGREDIIRILHGNGADRANADAPPMRRSDTDVDRMLKDLSNPPSNTGAAREPDDLSKPPSNTGAARDSEGASAHRSILEAVKELDVLSVRTSPESGCLEILIATENLPDAKAYVEKMRSRLPSHTVLEIGLGSLCVVGGGIGEKPMASLRALEVLNEADIRVLESLTARASITLVVRVEDVNPGMRALHRAFIENPRAASRTSGPMGARYRASIGNH